LSGQVCLRGCAARRECMCCSVQDGVHLCGGEGVLSACDAPFPPTPHRRRLLASPLCALRCTLDTLVSSKSWSGAGQMLTTCPTTAYHPCVTQSCWVTRAFVRSSSREVPTSTTAHQYVVCLHGSASV
jgi:hypothetical protein